MDAEELEAFRDGLRRATATSNGESLDRALCDLGWRDALVEDPRVAVSTLFELQGDANAMSTALDLVLAGALGLDTTKNACVVLPPLGSWRPPAEMVGEGLAAAGLATSSVRRQPTIFVVARANGGLVCAGVEVRDVKLRPVNGLDPSAGLSEATADQVHAVTTSECASDSWAAAVAAGQRAISHELIGASRAMLRLAAGHARERVQFGRPIAAFQAVRHRLADSFVAIEAAEAAVGAAWDDGSPLTAALAKQVAGRSSRVVAHHCQQVLAGIGFTTEHPFHRYLRRTLVLDRILGDARTLSQSLGEQLIATRQLPSLVPL